MLCLVRIFAALMFLLMLRDDSVLARQDEADAALPGLTVETIGSGPVANGGEELALLRVTLEPGASVPPHANPRAAVISVERGRVAVEIASGTAELVRADGAVREPLFPGGEAILRAGEAIAYDDGTSLIVHSRNDVETTLLVAALTVPGGQLFASGGSANAAFSVETFACPRGMTLATLDPGACPPSETPLVAWTLASDELGAPLTAAQVEVEGPTTTWQGLPAGTYFVDLTAESFAAGYADYFIPSSNQVTRQDARTTRISFNAAGPGSSINAYVFAEGAGG